LIENNFTELGARAEYLSGLGVSTVIISDVLKKDDGGTVDFKAVDESYGTNADFADAVKKLKTAGMLSHKNINSFIKSEIFPQYNLNFVFYPS